MGCCLKQRPHNKITNRDDFLNLIEIEKQELSDLIDNIYINMIEWKKELILLIISGMTELYEKIRDKNVGEDTGYNFDDLMHLFDGYYDLKEKVLLEEDDDRIYNNEAMRCKMNSMHKDHFFKKLNAFLGYTPEFISNSNSFISVHK